MDDNKVKTIQKLKDITVNPRNSNLGTPRGADLLEESLRRFGAGRSILVDKNGKVIAGSHIIEKAAEVGIDDIVTVRTRGQQLVVVQREDMDLDTDALAVEFSYVDNRTQQVNYSLDTDILVEDLVAGLDLTRWYEQEELDLLTANAYQQEVDNILDAIDHENSQDDNELWTVLKIELPQRMVYRFRKLLDKMPGQGESDKFQSLLDYAEEQLFSSRSDVYDNDEE